MKSCAFFVLLMVDLGLAKIRSKVVVTGTTMGPNFKRQESELSLVCPEEHPWSFLNGTRCCSSYFKPGQGSLQFEDFDCSASWIKCPAKLPRKCVSLVQPSTCPSTHPFNLGVGCCAEGRAPFDPVLDEACAGQAFEPYVTPTKCCLHFLSVPTCSALRQLCKTNYLFVHLDEPQPPKTILTQGNSAAAAYGAKHIFKDTDCRPNGMITYWFTNNKLPTDPPIYGFFTADFGMHKAIRKFTLRNSHHDKNSGTKLFEIRISNYSDSNWMSVINGTLDNPISNDWCHPKLKTFELPQAVIFRYLHFIAYRALQKY